MEQFQEARDAITRDLQDAGSVEKWWRDRGLSVQDAYLFSLHTAADFFRREGVPMSSQAAVLVGMQVGIELGRTDDFR